VVALVFAAGAVHPPGARGSAAGCLVRISRFAFRPSTVAEGDPTTLRLSIRNCTDGRLRVTLTQFGTEPPPCPVLDPVSSTVTLHPEGRYRRRTAMTAPPCPGIEKITLRVTGPKGRKLDERTARLRVTSG